MKTFINSDQLSLFECSVAQRKEDREVSSPETREETEDCAPAYQARTFYPIPQFSGTPNVRKRQNRYALDSSDPKFIYQNYSGIGGLYGVDFKDFGNFHDYTQAKQDFEMGQFFTPSKTAKLIVEMLEIEPGRKVADICCGMGNFFNHLKDCDLYGIETDEDACRIAEKLYPHAHIQAGDIRYMDDIPLQDYIVGNPPFNLVWEDDRNPLRSSADKILSQDYYAYQCFHSLKEGGFLAFVCPKTWLTDELRHGKVNSFLNEHFVRIFEIYLPSDLFQGVGVKKFATKILGFQKKIPGRTIEYTLLKTEYEEALKVWRNSETSQQFRVYKPLAFRHQAEQKYRDYFTNQAEIDREKEPERRYIKYLFELKRINPKLAEKAEGQRREVETARKPENMDWEVWEKKKTTLENLIRKMKRQISKKKPQHLIRLVKTKSLIKLKGYSREAIQTLNSLIPQTVWSINKLINKEYWKDEWESFQYALKKVSELAVNGIYYRTKEKTIPIEYKNFSAQAYLQAKQREFQNLRADISSLTVFPYLKMKLERMQLGDKRLLPHQVEDVGKALQKPSALLNWEMGTFNDYRLKAGRLGWA